MNKKYIIKKLAKKVKKELKNNIDIISVIDYLQKCGYSTVFFNNNYGDEELTRYGLESKKQLTAFAYSETAHIVFVDSNTAVEDRLYLLLHELGHIVLKHIGDGNLIHRNHILIDIEADAFAYEILNHK